MSLASIPGVSLTIGDSIRVLGRVRRITRIVPYVGDLVDIGLLPSGTRIAYEDDGSARPWGMTIVPDAVIEVVR